MQKITKKSKEHELQELLNAAQDEYNAAHTCMTLKSAELNFGKNKEIKLFKTLMGIGTIIIFLAILTFAIPGIHEQTMALNIILNFAGIGVFLTLYSAVMTTILSNRANTEKTKQLQEIRKIYRDTVNEIHQHYDDKLKAQRRQLNIVNKQLRELGVEPNTKFGGIASEKHAQNSVQMAHIEKTKKLIEQLALAKDKDEQLKILASQSDFDDTQKAELLSLADGAQEIVKGHNKDEKAQAYSRAMVEFAETYNKLEQEIQDVEIKWKHQHTLRVYNYNEAQRAKRRTR